MKKSKHVHFQRPGRHIVALILTLAVATPLGWAQAIRDAYQINHAGQRRVFEVAKDEVYVRSAPRGEQIRKIDRKQTAEEVRLQASAMSEDVDGDVDVVLYEAGSDRTPQTRTVLTRDVLVKVKSGADAQGIAAEAGVPARAVSFVPGYFMFTATGPAGALILAENLRLRNDVDSAEPQLGRIVEKRLVPNDVLFPNQWHLLNTGQQGGTSGVDVNVTNVWPSFRGSGIVIGIVDDGVQVSHPDLVGNVNAALGWDWNDNDNDPSPDLNFDFHGTAVAGVAAATGNNGIGAAGAAFEAGIAGMRLIAGFLTDNMEASAMLHSNQVIHILNNSWGPPDTGTIVEGPGPLTAAALEGGALLGRGGRGSIFVWAGGNGRANSDNANFDGYASSIFTIAVGASDDRGAQTWYSEPGACILITAPSGNSGPAGRQDITTTDLVGDNGYNSDETAGDYDDKDYTSTFSGTSSAAPLAAGVIALILEANPNLGWRDVQEILIRSAVQISPGDPDWILNGGGFRFNHKFGAGMINAAGAVALASGWMNLPAQTSVVVGSNDLNLSIPDNNSEGLLTSFSVSSRVRVEHVTVRVDIEHARRGDLEVLLVSPQGTVSRLAERRFGDMGRDLAGWTFMTVHNWGEDAEGTWTVQVRDVRGGLIGTVQGIELEIFGTPGEPVVFVADAGVMLRGQPDPVILGSSLLYTMTVTNTGSTPLTGVRATQRLPASVITNSAVTVSQGVASHAAGVVMADIGSVPVGGAATMTISVLPTVAGTIFSTATVTANETDENPVNNAFVTSTRVIPPSADLTVSLFDSPDPVLVGGTLTYSVTVSNRGPSTVTGVMLTNMLPASAAFVSAIASQGSHQRIGNQLIHSLGTLTNGARATASIAVRPGVPGGIVATSSVGGNRFDPVPVNNHASAQTTVSAAANIGVTLTAFPDPVVVGSNVTYTISVTNRGPNAATGLIVNNTLHSSLSFAASEPSQGSTSVSGSLVTWSAGLVPAGGVATLAITAESSQTGLLPFTSSITASQADPDSSDNTTSISVLVADPFVSIAPAGAVIVGESLQPSNGAVDIGETVTVGFRLRNSGNVANQSLIATLLPGGGVSVPSGSQTYGVLDPSGLSISRPFTFTATGAPGGVLTATMQLSDGGTDLGTVQFSFPLPTRHEFAATVPIAIPEAGDATPYPSEIHVHGIEGLLGRAEVTIHDLSHTFANDVEMLLVGPTGASSILMAGAGGESPVSNATITFDNAAVSAVPSLSALTSGTFRPALYGDIGSFSAPAPPAPYEADLRVFNGSNPNGTWSLFVRDAVKGDFGVVAGGWSLVLTAITPVNRVANLSLSVADAPDPVLVGDVLTYTFRISNSGPDPATDVSFSSILPPTAEFVGLESSAGVSSVAGSLATCSIALLPVGGEVTVILRVRPGQAGTVLNAAGVNSAEIDLSQGNNSAVTSTLVLQPDADVGVQLEAAPAVVVVGSNLTYTAIISNQGPQVALNVTLTNLFAGAQFVTASVSHGTFSQTPGRLVAALGNLQPGEHATVTTTVRAVAVGDILGTAVVTTRSHDGNPENNAADIATLVTHPLPVISGLSALVTHESFSPGNQAIDPGETVTLLLTLGNVGAAQATNLTATLLAGEGVLNPGLAQTYGTLPVGASAARSFTFTAVNEEDHEIAVTLSLRDGTFPLGTVRFVFRLSSTATFASGGPIRIPEWGPAQPYPSVIGVSGLSGVVGNVTVTLHDLAHTFPSDLSALLTAPGGAAAMLMAGAGGGIAVSDVTLTFSDQATAVLPDSGALLSGIFRPTTYRDVGSMPVFAPPGPYAGALDVFEGRPANGTWGLYVSDDMLGDMGRIGGWSLLITTIHPVRLAAEIERPVLAIEELLPDGRVRLRLTGEFGLQGTVQVSSNLADWTPVQSFALPLTGSQVVVDEAATGAVQRFYRAVIVP